MANVVLRSEALSAGLKRYFTGKPCIYGHTAERSVSSKSCLECASLRDKWYKAANRDNRNKLSRERYAASDKEDRRAYYRLNKEKYKERSDKRYAENRDQILSAQRKKMAENPGLGAIKSRKYKDRHPERVSNAYRAQYLKNRSAVLHRQKEKYAEDPSKATAKAALRRARLRRAVPKWFGELDGLVWQEAARLVRLRGLATGFDWHADHMVAVAGRCATGLHTWNNCQVIPTELNLWKHNKFTLTEPLEWLKYI